MAFLNAIRTESELVGEAAMLCTPVAIKKSVVFTQVAPLSNVFQKPPALDPKYIFDSSVGST